MSQAIPDRDRERLRCEIRREYVEATTHPEKGFHFHTLWPLATFALGNQPERAARWCPMAKILCFRLAREHTRFFALALLANLMVV